MSPSTSILGSYPAPTVDVGSMIECVVVAFDKSQQEIGKIRNLHLVIISHENQGGGMKEHGWKQRPICMAAQQRKQPKNASSDAHCFIVQDAFALHCVALHSVARIMGDHFPKVLHTWEQRIGSIELSHFVVNASSRITIPVRRR